ncbi:MAG TPA: hypothetical protein DGD08_01235 [Gemmatimonas aurantiaca]|uniref:Uncharacterized protein n=2 Tax=Gemmatimonas aurantiaca TaxID=173480 RepID=C1A588_GEMAT|nr:hypothetical protein [Gemmatimonas aurantiaca]BAH37398.1 hypothetical protein GAU_0356 [Gemmatimonas aurantiaca T-27]HCT55814.1 hypothetical protein [Gemmatimonas aurantiaca]
MSAAPERFGQLLQEKLDELDAAAEQEMLLAFDEVEQLRLQAAALVTRGEHRPWATGANTKYQHDQVVPEAPPPTLDIRFPTRPADKDQAGPGDGASSKRQGRRVP